MKKKNTPTMNVKLSNMGQASTKLARLLAGERLTVEHGNFRTASFSPSDRHIRLPIFKEMSDAMYFLFVSHEVGHALFTPADGWHNSNKDIPGVPRSYINIVEDIRIEKLIRRKYQGLYKEFFAGYADLLVQDFFGIKGKDISQYGFMNRLNIFSKCEGLISVPFSADEQILVDLAMSVETWEDVIRVCRLLREEVQKLPPMQPQNGAQPNENDEDQSSSDKESDSGETSEEGAADGDDDSDSDEAEDGSGTNDEESPNDEDDQTSKGQSHTGEAKNSKSNHDDTSVDEHYRKHEEELVDNDSIYVDLTVKISNVTHYKQINYVIDTNHYTAFIKKNTTLISKMVNEFNLRKASIRERRSMEAKTGALDPLKLFDYKFNEDIFLRHQTNPNEENHGVIMFLDSSGSMGGRSWDAVAQQAALMAEFYTRVGIKFRVYTWTSKGFSTDITKIELILCNSWPKVTYRKAINRLVKDDNWCDWGGTPQGDTYIEMGSYAWDLKETYNLDKVHLILMTDGPDWAAQRAPLQHYAKNVYVKLKNKTMRSSSAKRMQVYQHITNVYRQIFDSVGYYIVDCEYIDYKLATTKTIIKTNSLSVYEPIDFSYVVSAQASYILSALDGKKPKEFKKFLEIFIRHIA